MRDYILLMHNDATQAPSSEMWPAYLARLQASGRFDGGSAIADGESLRKTGTPAPLSTPLGGYIRVRAEDIAGAKAFLAGNPVYECGGTVEVRELPREA
ncbi:MAG: hypothetical protein IIZ38_13415 [Sphingomonas sp.]|uniref:YciI family protein n=1 Tax=unclassified Sphingomonas TaxID=196159 RepID=UPI0024577BB1|nr:MULTISPECIES: YciI family protein [unclassified Sphingomonas]MBQ1499306.1 hypothetical protein [Sphingomonas sp.]MDH4746725.1 YciI family protein [Sphingomonas sp. CBMAI 2297]